MTLRIFLIVAAVIFAVSGLGFLLAPGECLTTLGLTPDTSGLIAGRIAGQGFIAMAVAFWYSRNADVSMMSPELKGVLYGGCLFNILGVIVAAWATIRGQIAAIGWVDAAIHLVLALGFIYFAEMKRTMARA
jgi:hypothetical protein